MRPVTPSMVRSPAHVPVTFVSELDGAPGDFSLQPMNRVTTATSSHASRIHAVCAKSVPGLLPLQRYAIVQAGGSMKKAFSMLSLAFAACGMLADPASGQTAPATTTVTELKVGDQAPDFTLPATDGKTYTLSKDLKGRWVVLG